MFNNRTLSSSLQFFVILNKPAVVKFRIKRCSEADFSHFPLSFCVFVFIQSYVTFVQQEAGLIFSLPVDCFFLCVYRVLSSSQRKNLVLLTQVFDRNVNVMTEWQHQHGAGPSGSLKIHHQQRLGGFIRWFEQSQPPDTRVKLIFQ